MKKMVGTILTAVALVAFVPVNASAAKRLPPLPPTVQGGGASGGSTNAGHGGSTNASGRVNRPSKCTIMRAVLGQCTQRALPPVKQ